jgi:cell division protein FtsL
MWERSGHKHGAVRTPEVHREQRYIFNGEPPAPTVSGYAVRQNRRTVRRRRSPFNIILGLFVLGFVVVLYINNIIVVNQLVVDVNTLQSKYQKQLDSIALLQGQVNSRSSLDRIGKIATEDLGMQYPQEQPQVLPEDASLRERAEKVRQELGE